MNLVELVANCTEVPLRLGAVQLQGPRLRLGPSQLLHEFSGVASAYITLSGMLYGTEWCPLDKSSEQQRHRGPGTNPSVPLADKAFS